MTSSPADIAHAPGSAEHQRRPAFDPDRIAYFERAGWQAYYDRRWLRVSRLMVQLNRAEFGMSRLTAIAAALNVVRASLTFAPLDNDVPAATEHLRRYYEKVRRSAGIHADAPTLAALEVDYWVVHRRLAMARRLAPDHAGDIEPLVESLARLHSALFAAPAEAIRRSAEGRALAALTVDRITGGYSADVSDDWQRVEEHLRQAYRALQEVGDAAVP